MVKKGYAIYYSIKKWRHYLEDAEILLKRDVKSLQKFLTGRTDNIKLDRWSLELQGRNIKVQHIPGSQNKAADCLSRLPYITRNDNPLHVVDFSDIDEAASVNQVSYMPECRLCEIDLTDTAAQQLSDKHCIRIKNLMKGKSSKFHERDRYKEEKNVLYHTNIENGKEYKTVVVPKHLVPTVLKEMHDRFGHFGIGKTYSLIKWYYFWPKMIKHIEKHVENCSLCRHEKPAADKYQLQTTEIPDRPFVKVSVDLIVELSRTHQGNKNVVVMVDHLSMSMVYGGP